MKVKVVGKRQFERISPKNGQPYKQTEVYLLYELPGVEGLASEKIYVFDNQFSFSTILIGKDHLLERGDKGKVLMFEPIFDK